MAEDYDYPGRDVDEDFDQIEYRCVKGVGGAEAWRAASSRHPERHPERRLMNSQPLLNITLPGCLQA